MLRRITRLSQAIHRGVRSLDNINSLLIDQEFDRLRNDPRFRAPKSLVPFGHKVYSQGDEDGLIREVFSRIGLTNKVFVEFGIGDGLQNNTLSLLFDGWHGLWIDAASQSINSIRKHFSSIINHQLQVIESVVTKENINDVISGNLQDREIDLLSIDIDGNDCHVLGAITCIEPRVIIIEYNAKFAPPLRFCMDYNPLHTWKGDDCYGASLKFLESSLGDNGYCLVGCSLTGVNALFVRQDLVPDKFLEPFTAETHYQPSRLYLAGSSSGHLASYSSIARALTTRCP